MAKFLDKVLIKTGLQSQKQKFDLSCQNLTTQEFYQMKPIYFKEMIPGEKLVMDLSAFTRLSPLVNPMLGNVRIVNRAFFVPMRTVWKEWNDYITTNISSITGTKITSVPTLVNSSIVLMFSAASNKLSEKITDTQTIEDIERGNGSHFFDFSVTSASGSTTNTDYYKFTDKGKRFYDILLNLGYSINFGGTNETYGDTSKLSALPLLAYAKLWSDWFMNPQYNSGYSNVRPILTKTGTFSLTTADIYKLLNFVYEIYYDNNYFTAAFDTPNGPNANVIGSIGDIVTPIEPGTAQVISQAINNAPAIIPDPEKPIAHSTLSILESLTDYVKRIQRAGVRTLDRYFAEWGITLDSAKLDRSVYVGKNDIIVQISDVMQTSSDTPTQPLGSYAGKGIGFGQNGHFEYSTDEFGYFVITSYIEPRTSFVQGVDRHVLHQWKDDFFTPDFDNLGYQAIAKNEIFADYKGQSTYPIYKEQMGYDPQGVFGYSSRYAEYKCGKDKMTGDFRVPSKNSTLDTWHLNRLIPNWNDVVEAENSDISLIKHDLNLLTAEGRVYNRIFADRETTFDHFYTIFNFDVTVFANMKSLYNDYEFHSDGRDTAIQLQGTRVNS